MMMKIHLAIEKTNRYGGYNYYTLCGRHNKLSEDGANATDNPGEVTCKFCLKKLIKKEVPKEET